MAEDFRSAVIGSLVGLAVGDCLGVGVEGWSPDRITAQFGLIDDFRHDPAVWSDDTQQTLVLVESTVRNGVPDPDWVGRRFVQMRDALAGGAFGVHRGTGRGFRSAVEKFAETGDWRSSARTDRVGNGAAMRIAPIGVALRDLDDESLRTAIAEVSILTHREIRSIAAALAVAKTAAELSRSSSYPLENDPLSSLLQVLVDSVRETEAALANKYEDLFVETGAEDRFSETLGELAELWKRKGSLEELIKAIAEQTSARMGEPRLATDGYALASPITAIVIALGSASFEDALIRTVNLGGDADTTAAMVGGMVGAATGLDAIPERWRRFAGYEEVLEWAKALAGERSVDDMPDLLELEIRLTRMIRG